MNTIKRLVLGILSSLLLTAGFAQAAPHLDSTITTSLYGDAGQPIRADDPPPPPPPPPDDGGDDGNGGENGGGN